jgi:hypothetical protein
MGISFPPPNATFAEVTAFYENHGMTRPSAKPYDHEQKDTLQWIYVDGAEYCAESCRGWDGKSYRCDCGYYRCHFTGDAPGAAGTC